MSAKRSTRKTASKKKASKSKKAASKKTVTKKPKAKTAKAKVSKKKSAKASKARRSKPATPRTAAKTPTRRAATPKKKAGKKRRRPALDLRHFRRQLKIKQADLLQAYLASKGDSRSRESDGTEDYIDYAVSSYDREFLLSLTEMEQHQLALVEEALKRIERGEFGLCTHCERPIAVKRIEVQPWARYCLRCQELADSGLADERGEFPVDDEDERSEDLDEMDLDGELGDEMPDEDRLIGG